MSNWLTVPQVARDLGYTADTIRQYCAEGVFPGAAKAQAKAQAHWRIPEEDVQNFGSNRAIARTTTLDHKRRKELLRARRAS